MSAPGSTEVKVCEKGGEKREKRKERESGSTIMLAVAQLYCRPDINILSQMFDMQARVLGMLMCAYRNFFPHINSGLGLFGEFLMEFCVLVHFWDFSCPSRRFSWIC